MKRQEKLSGLRLRTDTIGWCHTVEHNEQDLTQDRRAYRRWRSIVGRNHRHSRALYIFPIDPQIALLAVQSLLTSKLLRLAAHVGQLIELRWRLVVHIGKGGGGDNGSEVCDG